MQSNGDTSVHCSWTARTAAMHRDFHCSHPTAPATPDESGVMTQEADDEGGRTKEIVEQLPSSSTGSLSKRSVKDKAQASIARFLACTEGWAEDNPKWDWVELVARTAQADLQRKIANASLVILRRSSSCPPL